jgi:hypothetical protein
MFRNSDADDHSESSAASCIQRSFRRRALLARSNRSLLEGGDASNGSLGGATVVAVGVGAKTSSPEEENMWKKVGWLGAKEVITLGGYKMMSGGGDPVDEDDAIAAASYFTRGPGGCGHGGGSQAHLPPVTTTVVP